MKTLEQDLESFKNEALDGRDAARLAAFLTVEQAKKIGVEFKNPSAHIPIPFNEDTVIKRLERDVAFGFEKALNRRGISSGLMFGIVRMWNNILEDGLENWDENNYAMYGLPLFKATALKYGFENPIGDDDGDEDCYNEDRDEDFF